MKGIPVNHSIEVHKAVWTSVSSMCFSPDGKKLACGTRTKMIRVYDVESGTLILRPLQGHQGCIQDVLWSHDGSRLFGSDDKAICCWNSDTGEQIGQPWTGHNSWIRSLSLSPDGLILASASWDKTVRFWNAITGHPIGQHLQHDKEVNVVRFSPSGEFVASAGWDEKIYLWRVPWLNSVENRVRTLIRCLGIHTYRSLYLTDKPY